MFFKAIAPACASGISFTIKVDSADNGKLAVSVIPASASGKSGFGLTPRQFVATPDEFDNEFHSVMAGFSTMQLSLSEQLKAAQLVADEVGKAAAEASAAKATDAAAKAKAKPAAPARKPNQAPGGLLDDDPTDGDGDEGEGDDTSAHGGGQKPSVPATTTPATSAFSFNM